MATPFDFEETKRKIEFHKAEIAKHRDALREIIDEAETVKECCDRALEALGEATDALSEQV